MTIFKEHPTLIKVLCIYLILLVAGYVLLLSPKMKTRRSLKANLSHLEGEVKRAREATQRVKLADAQERKMWAATMEKMARVSGASDFPPLMQELARQSLNSNIADAAFSVARTAPPPPAKDARVKMGDFLIKISFHSEYRDLALFLRGLDQLSQSVAIESLEVKKTSPLITVDLQVRPFSFILKK